MILGVSPVSLSNRYVKNSKPVKHAPAPSFHGLKNDMYKYTGLGLAALAMFATISCNGRKTDAIYTKEDTVENKVEININDNIQTEQNLPDKAPRTIYHYNPSDDVVHAEDYSWREVIYPDGKVKRDSMGYDITIDSNGGRTIEYKMTDNRGNFITIKEFPDGTKVALTDYYIPNESLSVKTTYWANGNIRLREYFNKYPAADSLTHAVDTAKYEYNQEGILLRWIDGIKDPERSDSNNVYDRYGRLEYDDVANERYFYKGKNKTPYQATSEYDGCIRYKIFNPDSTLNRVYFKATDGTITDADIQ